MREIRDKGKLDKNGRPITTGPSTRFYGYVICDLTSKIRMYAENAGFAITPDGMGYFGYNKNLETYMEVISYDKVLIDAQKRNRILFDKLFSSGISGYKIDRTSEGVR